MSIKLQTVNQIINCQSNYKQSMKWNLIRLGGSLHRKVTIKCTQKSVMVLWENKL